MSTSVKVRVIVSNNSSSQNSSSKVAKGHKHLSFLADYFNPQKKEYPRVKTCN
ncbi:MULTISPECIES: hypothetical protein [Acinetobacter]|uniref:hypothetical protein n=1 Tax=Acinetobacter TaxID=469 RepID=UPI0025C342B4|nr:hypothetical protein [Acinetobacter sp. UBA3025]